MAAFAYTACFRAGCFFRVFVLISILPHILRWRVLLIELPLQTHLVELLLQSVYSTGFNGEGELVFLRLVRVETVQSTGQLPVDSTELVEHLLRPHPGVVRLCR